MNNRRTQKDCFRTLNLTNPSALDYFKKQMSLTNFKRFVPARWAPLTSQHVDLMGTTLGSYTRSFTPLLLKLLFNFNGLLNFLAYVLLLISRSGSHHLIWYTYKLSICIYIYRANLQCWNPHQKYSQDFV